jgi:hypothetical protein
MNFKRVDVPVHLIERFNDEYFEALVSMSITISEEHADDEEAIWEAMAIVHSHMVSEKLVDNPPRTGQEKRTI